MAYNEWLSTSINIMPLKNVFIFLTTPYITPSYVFSFIKNIFGNIMLFLPMGYFYVHYYLSRFYWVGCWSFIDGINSSCLIYDNEFFSSSY